MHKLSRLRQEMQKRDIEILFITKLADIAWLSGFTGTAAYVAVSPSLAQFVTDGRYETMCREILDPVWELEIISRHGDFFKSFGAAHKSITLQPETGVGLWHIFQKAGAKISVDENDLMQELRMVKTGEEIELLRREYRLAGEAFLAAVQEWKYGQTERQWAALLEYKMKCAGADNPSFDTIVASGVRGALPHGVAGDKIINKDDAVTIDFGSARLYKSDYTRVVYGGKDREILSIIDIVREALEKVRDVVCPGVKCSDLDKIAREHIKDAGYGEYFNHSLGHGVGVEVHERPNINQFSDTVLTPGMAFTIEPGIYIPGKYGVRLEQTVAVNETGCELLSSVIDSYVYNL